MCEYANQIQLRETLHQIEHQHQRINDVRGELEERRQELTEANASRLSNPPSKIALLNKHVELLERELRSEEEQLEFYYRKKREHTDAAKEVEIDTVAELIDFQAHYLAKRSTVARSTADQASIIKEDRASQVVSTTKSHAKKDELLPSVDDVIGKFCYAGQRSQEQTKMFKECLRKSIEFIDDLLCKPPRGKVCVRGCKKFRDNRCAKDVPCDFEICRNWHSAEAHTDN